MTKILTGLLLCAALLIASLTRGSSAEGEPFVTIQRLEMARSLGGSTLATLLRSGDRLVALRAALAIGRTKRPGGTLLLMGRASDRDPAMRAMAIYALGLIGGAPIVVPVLRALGDSNNTVKAAALDALTRAELAHTLTPPEETGGVRRVRSLLHHADPLIRSRSATALEVFNDGSASAGALSALSAAYASEPDAFARWHIMWAVFRGYAKTAPAALLEAGLRDSDETVRIEAVRAYGRRGDRSALALLKPLLLDASWRVQEQTQESVTVLQGGKMAEHLKSIPSFVHLPAMQADPFDAMPPAARTATTGKPAKPGAESVITQPKLDPNSAAALTGPAPGPHPRVRLVTTKGPIYLELYPEWAPVTVENFLNLTNRGYYDNNPWFRIVPDFVTQTGDPTGNGNGDAGYSIPAEENPIEQDSYVVSMGLNYTDPPNAHAIRDSAGTQFYITLSPQLHLNSDFTVFGKVIAGQWVLARLVESDRIVRAERIADAPG